MVISDRIGMLMSATLSAELNLIRQVLSQFPEGVTIEVIMAHSSLNLPKRTLQRRLAKLQQLGQINLQGKTRGVKYYLSDVSQAPNPPIHSDAHQIPLSLAAQQTLQLVNTQIHQRKPVSYKQDFLTAYQPNVSAYLSANDIAKLTALGNTNVSPHPAGTYAKEVLNRLLIDLSWNSSRLEGNTYSLLDTQRLIDSGQSAEQHSTIESQMILNHKDAIEFLVYSADDIGFNRYTLLNLHGLLSYELLPDPSASGRLRHIAVGIGHSVYRPLSLPQDISAMFDVMLDKATQITNPFEQAFFIMVHLPYLQPFDDVNKRVSRLAANISLTKHNLSPLSFVDVPNDLYVSSTIAVYEFNRIDLLKEVFIWAYQRSATRYAAIRQTVIAPDPFRLQYREQIRRLISPIVNTPMTQSQATQYIKAQANELPSADQAQFISSVESELLSIHEGNFARYQVRPSAFAAWHALWF